MTGKPSTEEVAAELRLRMLSFDHRVQPPPDLFQRVVAPRRSARPAVRRVGPWSVPALAGAAFAVAALVLAVSVGAGLLSRTPPAQPAAPPPAAPAPPAVPPQSFGPAQSTAPSPSTPPDRPPAPPVAPTRSAPPAGLVLTVYNAERPCQQLRTVECGLGVYRDPRNPVPDQVVTRVWHGDRVTVACVVPDGAKITDEEGVSSTRWYRVTTTTTTTAGATGYLPGVRTRNTTEVANCAS